MRRKNNASESSDSDSDSDVETLVLGGHEDTESIDRSSFDDLTPVIDDETEHDAIIDLLILLNRTLRSSAHSVSSLDNQLGVTTHFFQASIDGHRETSEKRFYLQEHELEGDNDCALQVLGSDRKAVSRVLQRSVKDRKCRRNLAPEIFSALIHHSLESLVTEEWLELLSEYNDAERHLSLIQTHLVEDFPSLAKKSFDQRVEKLAGNARKRLLEAKNRVEEAERAGIKYCEQINVCQAYIREGLAKSLRIGYRSMLLFAKVKHITVYIWEKGESGPELKLLDAHIDKKASNTIHILHTKHYTQFNLLCEPVLLYCSESDSAASEGSVEKRVEDIKDFIKPYFSLLPSLRYAAKKIAKSVDGITIDSEPKANNVFWVINGKKNIRDTISGADGELVTEITAKHTNSDVIISGYGGHYLSGKDAERGHGVNGAGVKACGLISRNQSSAETDSLLSADELNALNSAIDVNSYVQTIVGHLGMIQDFLIQIETGTYRENEKKLTIDDIFLNISESINNGLIVSLSELQKLYINDFGKIDFSIALFLQNLRTDKFVDTIKDAYAICLTARDLEKYDSSFESILSLALLKSKLVISINDLKRLQVICHAIESENNYFEDTPEYIALNAIKGALLDALVKKKLIETNHLDEESDELLRELSAVTVTLDKILSDFEGSELPEKSSKISKTPDLSYDLSRELIADQIRDELLDVIKGIESSHERRHHIRRTLFDMKIDRTLTERKKHEDEDSFRNLFEELSEHLERDLEAYTNTNGANRIADYQFLCQQQVVELNEIDKQSKNTLYATAKYLSIFSVWLEAMAVKRSEAGFTEKMRCHKFLRSLLVWWGEKIKITLPSGHRKIHVSKYGNHKKISSEEVILEFNQKTNLWRLSFIDEAKTLMHIEFGDDKRHPNSLDNFYQSFLKGMSYQDVKEQEKRVANRLVGYLNDLVPQEYLSSKQIEHHDGLDLIKPEYVSHVLSSLQFKLEHYLSRYAAAYSSHIANTLDLLSPFIQAMVNKGAESQVRRPGRKLAHQEKTTMGYRVISAFYSEHDKPKYLRTLQKLFGEAVHLSRKSGRQQKKRSGMLERCVTALQVHVKVRKGNAFVISEPNLFEVYEALLNNIENIRSSNAQSNGRHLYLENTRRLSHLVSQSSELIHFLELSGYRSHKDISIEYNEVRFRLVKNLFTSKEKISLDTLCYNVSFVLAEMMRDIYRAYHHAKLPVPSEFHRYVFMFNQYVTDYVDNHRDDIDCHHFDLVEEFMSNGMMNIDYQKIDKSKLPKQFNNVHKDKLHELYKVGDEDRVFAFIDFNSRRSRVDYQNLFNELVKYTKHIVFISESYGSDVSPINRASQLTQREMVQLSRSYGLIPYGASLENEREIDDPALVYVQNQCDLDTDDNSSSSLDKTLIPPLIFDSSKRSGSVFNQFQLFMKAHPRVSKVLIISDSLDVFDQVALANDFNCSLSFWQHFSGSTSHYRKELELASDVFSKPADDRLRFDISQQIDFMCQRISDEQFNQNPIEVIEKQLIAIVNVVGFFDDDYQSRLIHEHGLRDKLDSMPINFKKKLLYFEKLAGLFCKPAKNAEALDSIIQLYDSDLQSLKDSIIKIMIEKVGLLKKRKSNLKKNIYKRLKGTSVSVLTRYASLPRRKRVELYRRYSELSASNQWELNEILITLEDAPTLTDALSRQLLDRVNYSDDKDLYVNWFLDLTSRLYDFDQILDFKLDVCQRLNINTIEVRALRSLIEDVSVDTDEDAILSASSTSSAPPIGLTIFSHSRTSSNSENDDNPSEEKESSMTESSAGMDP